MDRGTGQIPQGELEERLFDFLGVLFPKEVGKGRICFDSYGELAGYLRLLRGAELGKRTIERQRQVGLQAGTVLEMILKAISKHPDVMAQLNEILTQE